MTDNVHNFPDQRRGSSANGRLLASPEQTTALLTACLALVRPVGMGDDEALDWLGAAASTIGPVRLGVLDRACLNARRTCTHHSQIVPAIMADMATAEARAASIEEFTRPIALPPPDPRLTEDEFAEIVAERGRALSVALDRGLIVSNGDGTFRLPDRAA